MTVYSTHLNLSEIKPGNKVLILGYSNEDVPLKMLEMGLLPGNEILVKRLAPLRDPMHIEIAGYDLALRRDEAAQIIVEELAKSPD
jgi:Fe2+ transport system protein FeoA